MGDSLATLVFIVINNSFLLNFRFSVSTILLSALTLMGHIQRVRGFEGLSCPYVAILQPRLSFPPGCLQQTGYVCRHVGGGGNVQVFMLKVLPEQSAQVPVIANNMALDRG